ncbi:MAG: restriction endonuclease subunit S, partial [Nitrospirota bacterium]
MTTAETSRVATSTSGLRLVQLKDICDRITKGSTPTSYGFKYTREGIRFIKAENIDKSGLASTTTDYIDEATNDFLKRSILQEHDILFSIAGTIGRVGVIRRADLPANTNQALAIVRLQPSTVEHKYLFYYLKSDAIQKDALKRIVGVGRANLSLTNIGEFAVPLVPLDQQKQIVAEIEKQFSRLDEAVANLKRVKANLKRYKAAVLKAAVEGKLAPTERPWKQVVLGDIATSIRNGYSKKPDAEQGTRIFRISAVRPMKLDANDIRYLSGDSADYQSFLIESGDVLFTRYNGSRDYVGVCARVPPNLPPTAYPDKLIRVRVPGAMLLPEFLVILASTGRAREYIESKIRTTAGQSGISGGDLKSLPLD